MFTNTEGSATINGMVTASKSWRHADFPWGVVQVKPCKISECGSFHTELLFNSQMHHQQCLYLAGLIWFSQKEAKRSGTNGCVDCYSHLVL